MAMPPLLSRVGSRLPRRTTAFETCILSNMNPQRTMASKARPAPSTRRKIREAKPYVPNAEDIAWRQEQRRKTEDLQESMPLLLTAVQKAELLELPISLANQFNRNQTFFVFFWLDGVEKGRSPSRNFTKSLSVSTATLDEVFEATVLLRKTGISELVKSSADMVRECSANGHGEAIIQMVAAALRQDRANRGANILQSRTALMEMGRLHELVKRGNARATVLEAHIASHQGQTGKAMELYQKAMDIMDNPNSNEAEDKYGTPLDDYSSPWVQLAILQSQNGQFRKSLGTLLYGMGHDDPEAFFNCARLDYRMQEEPEYTENWVYNMTKAAASGHIVAAHLLCEYYANIPAVPAPPPPTSWAQITEFLTSLFSRKNLNLDAQANMHHHVAFASDPLTRMALAKSWLQIAVDAAYLPAYNDSAYLCLQKYVYPSENLNRALDPLGYAKGADAVENPEFSPKDANDCLWQVLWACDCISKAKRESKTLKQLNRNAYPFTKFPEVWDAYNNESKIDDLRKSAIEIAEAVGIDVRAPDGAKGMCESRGQDFSEVEVLYRHLGTQFPRGEGLYELEAKSVDADKEELS